MNSSAELYLPADADSRDTDTGAPGPRWPVFVAIVLIALLLGGLAGFWLGREQGPSADSVDVGFARDMSVHHEQAVQMSALIYDRTEDEAIKSLAFDILTTQHGQIGIMNGWLDAWGLPWTSAEPQMVWMGHPTTGLMPGMATAEQMNALRAAHGHEADIVFLRLMIPHHVSGVEMAQYAADHADYDTVRLMAQSMVTAQDLEIAYMQELLEGKGEAPMHTEPAHEHDEADDGHEH